MTSETNNSPEQEKTKIDPEPFALALPVAESDIDQVRENIQAHAHWQVYTGVTFDEQVGELLGVLKSDPSQVVVKMGDGSWMTVDESIVKQL